MSKLPYECRVVNLFDLSDDEKKQIEDLVIACEKSQNTLEIRKCIAYFWGFKVETEE